MTPETENQSQDEMPNEPDGLEQDLQLFERSPNPDLRKFAAQQKQWNQYFKSIEPLLSKAAKQFGVEQVCANLSGEEIAFFIALPQHDGESNVRAMLRTSLIAPCQQRLGKSPCWDWEKVLTFLCLVFSYALRREYFVRRQKNENQDGRAIRRLLVDEKKRGELLMKLGKDVTHRWHASLFFLDEDWWESKETPAEATSKIWELISEFAKATPVAADPTALTAFMKGALNEIPGKGRDHVRNLIETELRRQDILTGVKGCPEDGENRDSRHPAPRQTRGKRVLVEMVPDKSDPRDVENKVLVEQLLRIHSLKPKDKELLRLCFFEGRSQKEAAASLGMRQGQVSKRLHSIRTALEKVVQSPIRIDS